MAINKKTLLGKAPSELGIKDAVHVACVSLRAGEFLEPGQEITLNDRNEAVANKSKSFGVVDPFLTKSVKRGENFWGLLRMHEVPNVRHVWDHPDFEFNAPTEPIKYNETLQEFADDLKISYKEFMEACDKAYENDAPIEYTGPISKKDFDKVYYDKYELWSEWAIETGIEFENCGTACCPEYEHPPFPFKYSKVLDNLDS